MQNVPASIKRSYPLGPEDPPARYRFHGTDMERAMRYDDLCRFMEAHHPEAVTILNEIREKVLRDMSEGIW